MADKTVGLTHPDLPDAPLFEAPVESVTVWEARGWMRPKSKPKPRKTKTATTKETS